MTDSAAELLAGLVAAAPGSRVVPDRPRTAPVDVRVPLRLVEALDLGSGRYVAVLADADGDRWTAPPTFAR